MKPSIYKKLKLSLNNLNIISNCNIFLTPIIVSFLWSVGHRYNIEYLYIKKAITGIEAIARKVVSWSCVCHLSPRILIKENQATLDVRKVGRINRTCVCVMVQIELGKLKRPRLRRFGTWFVTAAACYKRLKGNALVFLFFYLLPLFLNDHKFWLWERLSPAFYYSRCRRFSTDC